MDDLNILAIVPARSGSKSIPNKNIMSFLGKPLLVHSIDHALQSNYIKRVIVSTDSALYAEYAKNAGAEVPFLRPDEISQDFSTDLEVFTHALEYLITKENYKPDIVVHLRPTDPIRDPKDIDNMIELLWKNQWADSVRTIIKSDFTPFKMWFLEEDHRLVPVVSNSPIKEPYNMPRQVLRQAYKQTATIDVIRTSTILDKNSMSGEAIIGYELTKLIDIDNYQDFQKAQQDISILDSTNKKFCFDLDGVIAHLSPNNDYNLAQPNMEMIKVVNNLFEQNNHITIFTARGSETGIDWYDITIRQLESWKVKYHVFMVGKPNADYYIDDKNVLISQILNNR